MENKIYEKIKENEKQMAKKYSRLFGIDDNIQSTIPKKNMDLLFLLKKLELIPKDEDKLDEINEFHDYLFKYGIDLGIGIGKKLAIQSIQKGELSFEQFEKLNPEDIVNFRMEPTFISDLKEALK